MKRVSVSTRDVLRISLESHCAVATVRNFLQDRTAVRPASADRILRAASALGLELPVSDMHETEGRGDSERLAGDSAARARHHTKAEAFAGLVGHVVVVTGRSAARAIREGAVQATRVAHGVFLVAPNELAAATARTPRSDQRGADTNSHAAGGKA